jgi:hypothetical protein
MIDSGSAVGPTQSEIGRRMDADVFVRPIHQVGIEMPRVRIGDKLEG